MRHTHGPRISPLWLTVLLAVGLGVILLIAKLPQSARMDESFPAAPQEGSGEITDEQLQKFALVLDEVERVYVGLRDQQLLQTPGREAPQTEQEAQEQVTKVIRQNGMTVEEFNRIAQLLNEDPEVMVRFQSIQQQNLTAP